MMIGKKIDASTGVADDWLIKKRRHYVKRKKKENEMNEVMCKEGAP